jgi:hypothetical protein
MLYDRPVAEIDLATLDLTDGVTSNAAATSVPELHSRDAQSWSSLRAMPAPSLLSPVAGELPEMAVTARRAPSKPPSAQPDRDLFVGMAHRTANHLRLHDQRAWLEVAGLIVRYLRERLPTTSLLS